MSDLISRQAAVDALHMHLMYRMGTDSNKKRLDEWINNLPSAQPERKKGKWIIKDDTERFIAQCNCCRYIEDSRRIKNFCPNCGADMRGEQK